jgi:hypothetical protein
MKAEVRRQEAEGIKLILKAFCHLRMVGLFPPNCTSQFAFLSAQLIGKPK